MPDTAANSQTLFPVTPEDLILTPIRGDEPPANLRIAVEWFNTERAAMYIRKHSKYQRPVSKSTVKKYARDMRNANWKFNASPIQFDGVDSEGEPRMINGFHRMHALIEANAEYPFCVTYGIPQEAMISMDTGRNRTLAQVFHLDGVKSSSVVASAVKYLTVYLSRTSFRGAGFSIPEYVDTLTNHPALRELGKEYDRQMPPALSSGLITCLDYLFSQKDPVLAKQFCEQIVTGIDLSAGDPAYVAREWLIDGIDEKVTGAQVGSVLIDCWNKLCEGKRVTKIKVPRKCAEILSPVKPGESTK